MNAAPLLLHPWAGLAGLLLGLPAGSFLATCAERFAYDDESFDPTRGPREQDHVWLAELEDHSFLPWHQRIPFLGLLLGMVAYCHFGLLGEPAHCRDCQRVLPLGERLPLWSYLRLGGRCAGCAAPIPRQIFWLEATTPLLFFALFAIYGLTLEGLLNAFLAWLCVLASVVDWNFQIIPDEVPTAGMAVGLGTALATSGHALLRQGLPTGGGLQEVLMAPALADPFHLGWALAGAMVGGLALWVLQVLGSWWAGTTAMGGGDVKLAFALGLFVGPLGAGIALFYAAMLGGFGGMFVLYAGGGKREGGFTKFAFGPYICLGVLLVVLFGPEAAFGAYRGFADLVFTLATGGPPPPL